MTHSYRPIVVIKVFVPSGTMQTGRIYSNSH